MGLADAQDREQTGWTGNPGAHPPGYVPSLPAAAPTARRPRRLSLLRWEGCAATCSATGALIYVQGIKRRIPWPDLPALTLHSPRVLAAFLAGRRAHADDGIGEVLPLSFRPGWYPFPSDTRGTLPLGDARGGRLEPWRRKLGNIKSACRWGMHGIGWAPLSCRGDVDRTTQKPRCISRPGNDILLIPIPALAPPTHLNTF